MYKYISRNQIKRAPNPIKDNGRVYSNPTEKTLRELGYKELVVTDMPEVPDGKMAVPVYTDGETITQGWEIVDESAE
ncbi:MAG: hypothetical protein J6R99_00765 [Alphaproteobacteria bacterium]|nr:hypothetical protein [Alphaproteobacteria bacterium]